MKRVLIILACFVLTTGCASVSYRLTSFERTVKPGPYPATRLDFKVASAILRTPGGNYLIVPCLLDVPFSVIMDTVAMPYDLYQYRKQSIWDTFWDGSLAEITPRQLKANITPYTERELFQVFMFPCRRFSTDQLRILAQAEIRPDWIAASSQVNLQIAQILFKQYYKKPLDLCRGNGFLVKEIPPHVASWRFWNRSEMDSATLSSLVMKNLKKNPRIDVAQVKDKVLESASSKK